MYDAVNVDTMAKDIYLDALEPYILNDQLKMIPPQITQDLVSHFEQKGRFEVNLFIIQFFLVSRLYLQTGSKLFQNFCQEYKLYLWHYFQ